jgi:hypothetical protein
MRTVWLPALCAGLLAAALREAFGLTVPDALTFGIADDGAPAGTETGAEAEAVAVTPAATLGTDAALAFWSAPPEHPTRAATSTPPTTAAAARRRPRSEPATLPPSTAGRPTSTAPTGDPHRGSG